MFGPALHHCNFSLLWGPSRENPFFSGREMEVCTDFGRCFPRTRSCQGRCSKPALSSITCLCFRLAFIPLEKGGTIPVFKSVFSTERSSTWITEQLGVCQVFCAFYCPRKSDLSECKQKTGQFNQTTFTIVKFRWDNLHEKIRTSKCYCSSLKLTLTQNLFFF